jgi:hypothetical protein
MVIVDTTVWDDYLRGAENLETRWLDSRLERRQQLVHFRRVKNLELQEIGPSRTTGN